MAADCKSAAPCGLRRFESSPVHEAESPQRQRTIHGQRSSHPWERCELEGFAIKAHVAQLVERVLGKDEVTSSILVVGSRNAGVTQWLESRPSKPLVAGSNPVSRSL